jgi:ribosomal protein L9
MKTAFIKLTAAITVDSGHIAKAGEIVEVPEHAAKNLIQRGKAELATEEDQAEDEQAEATAEPAQAELAEAGDEAAAEAPAKPAKAGKASK